MPGEEEAGEGGFHTRCGGRREDGGDGVLHQLFHPRVFFDAEADLELSDGGSSAGGFKV